MNALIVATVVLVVLIIYVLLLMNLLGRLYYKVGPNQALIVYGLHDNKVVVSGGAFVMPMFQRAQVLSLELMLCDIASEGSFRTREGAAVQVAATSLLKVRSSREGVLTAAERFLSKTDAERVALLRPAMESYLRGVVSQLTVEQLVREPQTVNDRMRASAAADLDRMGLEVEMLTIEVETFTIKEILTIEVEMLTIKEVRDENDRSLI